MVKGDKTGARVGTIPAKQARSQRTVVRIEQAARRLLQQKRWPEITMADLGKAAETHIGSIYARFESKAALLDHLDEIYCLEMIDQNAEFLRGMEVQNFEQALTSFVGGLAKYHKKNSGLIRTLILETRTSGHLAFHARSKRMNETLQACCVRLVRLSAAEGRKISSDKMKWALFLILSTVREAVLFGQGVPRPSPSLTKQIEEITLMALGYLERK